MLERFNTILRSFSKRLDTTIRTVAHVTDHLMPRGCSLRKKPIPNSLHFTADQKLSRYSQNNPSRPHLHFTMRPGLPFSSVNVSASSASVSFMLNVIVSPLISPEYVAGCDRSEPPARTGPPRSGVNVPRHSNFPSLSTTSGPSIAP